MFNNCARAAAIFASAVFVTIFAAPSHSAEPQVQRKMLLQQDSSVPGETFALLDVVIPVGGREGRHTHPGDLIAYVVSGDVTLDYEGSPTKTYHPGESFFVKAGKIHEGINMGNAPVHVLAAYVGPKGQPLTAQAK
jgi:quercetin dioxygenase-like cupin family protein